MVNESDVMVLHNQKHILVIKLLVIAREGVWTQYL